MSNPSHPCGPVQRQGQETRAERSFANGRPNVRVTIESALELGMLRVAEHDAEAAQGYGMLQQTAFSL